MPAFKALGYIASAIGGAILITIFAFSMDWVMTTSLAETNAEKMSAAAVKEELVPICVYQFNRAPNRDESLAELQALQDWERRQYVNEHGWSTMPGADSPVSGVAADCAAALTAQG